ncbi:MAG: hypothetical protein KAW17_06665 [Candidatus Eisenbacteria sp.]|nr:hypothetical protein [Candidatus Eisenbacteria bacterium]
MSHLRIAIMILVTTAAVLSAGCGRGDVRSPIAPAPAVLDGSGDTSDPFGGVSTPPIHTP